MDKNNQLALIVAYYLSRFDRQGLSSLNYVSFQEAYESISNILTVNKNSIKNMRDEFDPYFENPRVGWYQRNSRPSRKVVLDKFNPYTEQEMTRIVKQILSNSLSEDLNELVDSIEQEESIILKDLNKLSTESKERFINEFKSEDVQLSEDFKNSYGAYLREIGQNISFQSSTAVITTAGNLKIYAPNQWFVIAGYMVNLVQELRKYKDHLEKILTTQFSNATEKREYIKNMKENPTTEQKELLRQWAERYIKTLSSDEKEIKQFTEYMVLFAGNYDSWHGSKTIDRGDYYVSPVLNLIGVVNSTQSYIADIAYILATNPQLSEVTEGMLEGSVSPRTIISPTGIIEYARKTGGQNLIVYGAPGTGKSRKLEDMFGVAPLTRRVVFHPEYSYYDFVGTYKPVPVYKDSREIFKNIDGTPFTKGEPYIDYRFVPGPFTTVLVEACLDLASMHTLLIEEINRASAAAVFGEIFQLLDRKADGSSEYNFQPSKDLEAYLLGIDGMNQFIKSGITLPSNMNIVATMNSADQGVNLIDSAFKRRWNYAYLRIDIGSAVHG